MVRWRSVLWVVALLAGLVCAGAALAGGPLGEQVRVSQAGPDGNPLFRATFPAVAYSPAAQQFLVVWTGDTATAGEREIWGRFLDGSGNPLGGQFRISDMGPDGDPNYDAVSPAVAHNPTANEYLVTWIGDDNTAPLDDNEFEIFVQRLSATGAQLGADTRISDMGPDGDTAYGAFSPAVAHNPVANEYLVAWMGDDNTAPLVDNEVEIFVQRLSATGNELGTDTRISSMGPDGGTAYNALSPAVAHNPVANEYLVTWEGDDNTAPLVDNEREIFVQRLSATGNELGTDTRISDMGPNGDPNYDASRPAVTHNPVANEYLVTWMGDDNTAPLVDGEDEIFVQRLSATGNELGTDTRISSMGPNGDPNYDAVAPAVAHNPAANEYLVTWEGDDNTAPLVDDEEEIYVQRLSATGNELGTDTRISSMGPDGDTAYGAFEPAVAHNPSANEYLVTWYGDDNTAPLVDGEDEIFARRALAGAPPPAPPPGTDTRAPAVRYKGGRTLTLGKRRTLTIPLRCPAHETNGCTGTTTIRTTKKIPARRLTTNPERALTLTHAKARRITFIKNKTFTIKGGKTKNIRVRLSKKNNAILRRLKKVRVQVITKAQDQTGNTRTTKTTKRIVLKAPARKNNN